MVVLLLLVGAGCGSDDSSKAQEASDVQQSRAESRREARELARLKAEWKRKVEQREIRLRERWAAEEAEAEAAEGAEGKRASSCDPNYSGACLVAAASDYDCEGGSGDGPLYTGIVNVVGEDHHGLDSDGDGVGCE